MRARSIMYHDVVEQGDFASSGFPGEAAHLYKLTREEFERHLAAIAAAIASTAVPVATIHTLTPGAVLLTFDDGGSSFHHPIAPLLEARGWRGHFFITTDRIGAPGFLTEDQIRDLHRRGHIIGSHSCSHPVRMAALGRDALLREWRQSLDRLSTLLGEPVTIASVPGGYYSRQVGESARAAGVTALFTSEPTSQTASVNGCLLLGRFSLQRGMGPEWSAGFASGNPIWCLRQAALWKAKRIAKALGGSAYLKLRSALIDRNSP